MFSDRGWILKLGAAMGLLALLCSAARRYHDIENPSLDRAAVFSEADRKRVYHGWGMKIDAVEPAGFRIDSTAGPIHFVSDVRPPAGEYVSFLARATGPRTLEVVRMQVCMGFGWKRPLTYLVSILTLAGFVWLVRDRFRWRIHEGVFRSRY